MAENKNDFNGTVQSLFSGMSGVLSTKTVVGDAVTIGDTIILPLVDVSFGMAAGAKKNGVQTEVEQEITVPRAHRAEWESKCLRVQFL